MIYHHRRSESMPFVRAWILALLLCFAVVAHSWTIVTLTRSARSSHRHHVLSRRSRLLDSSSTDSLIHKPTCLYFFGGMFGGDESADDEQLAVYEVDTTDDPDRRIQALSDYLQSWAKLFETKTLGLTTPVKVRPSPLNDPTTSENGFVVASGVQILFQNIDTGYKSKREEDEQESQQDGKPKKDVSQGGVEVLVERNSETSQLQVRARRCEMDEETIRKEMSEQTILKELKKAIEVFQKQ